VKQLSTHDLLIGIQWTTAAGLLSMPMGFAPFATMPVTRRIRIVGSRGPASSTSLTPRSQRL